MASNTTVIEAESGALAAVTKTPPDEARNRLRTERLLALARSLEVKTPAEYALAADELASIKSYWADMEADRVSFTGPLNDVLNRLNARFQPYLKILCGDGKKGTECAESIIKGKMAEFTAAEQRKADLARREAEARAAAERKRLEDLAEAERQRAAAEARRLRDEEEARQAAARAAQEKADAEAAAAKGKKAKAEAQARAAELARQNEEAAETARQLEEEARLAGEAQAQALEMTAAVVIAQPVAVTQTRVAGVSSRKAVDYELTDLLALATFVVKERPDLIYLLNLDSVKARAHVKLQGMQTDIPGLRVFETTSIASRAR